MDKDLIEMRIDFLKQMDSYILCHGDYSEWKDILWLGCERKRIFKMIAEDTETWNYICNKFGELTEED